MKLCELSGAFTSPNCKLKHDSNGCGLRTPPITIRPPTIPRFTSRELSIRELVQWETELPRAFWLKATRGCPRQRIERPASTRSFGVASKFIVIVNRILHIIFIIYWQSLSLISPSSASSSSDSLSTSSSTSSFSLSLSSALRLLNTEDTFRPEYLNYRQVVSRIRRFLAFLRAPHLISPNAAPIFSQLGLVLNLYKACDPKRFRRNLRVDPSTFDFLFILIINDPVFTPSVKYFPASY